MSLAQQGDGVADATPLSMEVIDAIAKHEGIEPVDLDTPIYDVIDLDALDALTRDNPETTSIEVSFTYERYEVTVDNDRDIDVTPIDAQ